MDSANFIPLGSSKERAPFDEPEKLKKPGKPKKVKVEAKGDHTLCFAPTVSELTIIRDNPQNGP